MRTLNILLLLCCFSVFAVNLKAQTADDSADLYEDVQKAETKLIDEFGALNECSWQARFDNVFWMFEKNKDAQMYVIFYEGKNIMPAKYKSGRLPLWHYKSHLTLVGGLAPERLTMLDGGFRDKETTEVWIVPRGAQPPQPTKTIAAPEIPHGKTFLYNQDRFIEFIVNAEHEEFSLPHIKNASIALEIENSIGTVEDSMGTVEDSSIETENIPSEKEIEEIRFEWVDNTFAAAVKNEKNSRGVILFYADDQYYDVAKLKAFFEEGTQKLAKSEKLALTKFQITYGGYRDHPSLEMWVVPENGASPTPTPTEREPEEPTEESEDVK